MQIETIYLDYTTWCFKKAIQKKKISKNQY